MVAVALNDPSVWGQFGHLQVKKAESNHTIIEGDGAGSEQLEEGLMLDWLLQHSTLNDQFLIYAVGLANWQPSDPKILSFSILVKIPRYFHDSKPRNQVLDMFLA
jgi:hypothetical protein